MQMDVGYSLYLYEISVSQLFHNHEQTNIIKMPTVHDIQSKLLVIIRRLTKALKRPFIKINSNMRLSRN